MKYRQTLIVMFIILPVSLMLLLLNSCASTPYHEDTQQYIDSSTITATIKTKLLADPDIRSLSISVTTFKDRVTLTGVVDSYAEKKQAVEIARRVHGVKSVTDALIIGHH